ncbi:PREDICTED: histone H2B-like [Nanorana parkeri]|uniref:histone H2B-like n=1 Tax=Nanorana parkeri TaxID=125878 RepID=UPI000854987C|nr:PREDICTED: histone H2B-like [Nanorana parkeri]
MKPVAVVKRSSYALSRRPLLQSKGMGKFKKQYEKRISQVLNQVHPTTIQQSWALDQLSAPKAGGTLCSQVALEAARLAHSKPRNAISSKEICAALRNLNSAKRPRQCKE